MKHVALAIERIESSDAIAALLSLPPAVWSGGEHEAPLPGRMYYVPPALIDGCARPSSAPILAAWLRAHPVEALRLLSAIALHLPAVVSERVVSECLATRDLAADWRPLFEYFKDGSEAQSVRFQRRLLRGWTWSLSPEDRAALRAALASSWGTTAGPGSSLS